MTDRLSNLLHDAASTLDTPSLSAGEAMAQGRRLRLRRRAGSALAGAVAVVLVAVGASVATQALTGGDDAVTPADQVGYEQHGAWAVGNEVHVGNHTVEVSGKSPLAIPIGYSAAGALVGVVDLATDDNRSSIMLVAPDGTTRQLGKLGEIGSDPESSVIVYARATSEPDTWELVAHDLASGELRTVGTPWQANDAPQISMSGDLVVYTRSHRMVTINWRTGEPRRLTDVPEIGMTTTQSFGHGGYLTAPDPNPDHPGPTSIWHLRGLPDGDLLGTFPSNGDGWVQMSPDGRFVMTGGNGSVTVYDTRNERATPLELSGSVNDYGWTPDGHVVGARDSHVVVCDPLDGSCTDVGELDGERLSLAHGAFDTDPMAGG